MYRIIGYNEPTDMVGFIVLDPRVNRYVSSGKLTLKESDIDDLTLTVNQASPLWDNVRPYHTHVNVYDDDELIFRGRAIKPKKSMEESGQFIREYIFEDIEAYLMDSTQRFYEGVGQTPKEFLETLIDVHNSQVSEYKQFQVRNVNVTNNKDDQYRQIDYPKTSEAINDKLVKSLGGYIVTTYNPNGLNYLDYLTDIGADHKDDTPIQLAKNMKSASMQIDPTKVITRVIPLGKTLDPEKVEVSGDSDGSFGDGAKEPVNGDWTPVMQYAAKLVGEHLSDADIASLKNRIRIESTGDENAVNNWDSNAQAGTPSKGLMQFVERTFRYYAREPFTTWVGQGSGLCQLVATMNIPNWRQQIAGSGGWSPHGAPISKEPIKVVDTGSWGWPFPNIGEGNFSAAQRFGHTGWFGRGGTDFHDGLDFGSVDHPGRDVHCIHSGTVIIKSYMAGLGNYVVTHSSDGFNIVYQEAFSSPGNIIVNVGQKIKTGDVIGYRDTDHVHIGITKMDFYQAVRNSYSEAGGWLDPQKLIKEGGDGSKPQSGTQTVDNSNAPRPKLTITSVNDGKDYIDIPDLQQEFGIIEGKVEFDGVDDPNILLQQARAWIDAQRIPESWEVSALELHMANFKSFKVADRYMFINPNVAKTQLLRITQKAIDLLKPHASTLTIGDKALGITDYQLENSRNQQEFLNFKVNVDNRFARLGNTASQSSGQITDNANTKNVAQLQFDMKQLHKVVDDDLPSKYVSIESFNKLKEQVEKLTAGGDDSGK